MLSTANLTTKSVTGAILLKNDPSTKAVVVTGYGNRAFVAGADIKEMSTFAKPSEAEAFALMLNRGATNLNNWVNRWWPQ